MIRGEAVSVVLVVLMELWILPLGYSHEEIGKKYR